MSLDKDKRIWVKMYLDTDKKLLNENNLLYDKYYITR